MPDPQVHEQNEIVSVSDSQDHKSVSDQPSGHDCGDVVQPGRASTCSEQDKLLSNTQQESDVGHSEQATCSEASCSEQGEKFIEFATWAGDH